MPCSLPDGSTNGIEFRVWSGDSAGNVSGSMDHISLPVYQVRRGQRFNIDESHQCECGVPLQTRDHIFAVCTKHKLLHSDCRVPKYIGELWYFLDTNPKAFAQRTPGPLPKGVG